MPRALRLAVAFASLPLLAVGVYLSGWGRPVIRAESGLEGPSNIPSTASRLPSTGSAGTGRLDDDGSVASRGLQKAILAAGCFWCTESDFDDIPGVVSTTSGYTGGAFANPTYAQVSAGGTGHVESVEVLFDPRLVQFEQLLDHYWHNVDPFNAHGQFCDYGEQYRPVIFVRDAEQRRVAEASKARLQQKFTQRIVVDIVDATTFYPAESYHQDYGSENPVKYCLYRWGCGRSARLAEIWRQAR